MHITMEDRVRSRDSLCEFRGGKSGTETIFFSGQLIYTLSVPLYLSFTLIFILLLLLSKGQAEEAMLHSFRPSQN